MLVMRIKHTCANITHTVTFLFYCFFSVFIDQNIRTITEITKYRNNYRNYNKYRNLTVYIHTVKFGAC